MEIVAVIVLIIFLFSLAIIVSMWRTRRAVAAAVKIFREYNAIDAENAKTAVELGLNKKPFFERMVTTRDYKPDALQALINTGVIIVKEDGKLYLSEKDVDKIPHLKKK